MPYLQNATEPHNFNIFEYVYRENVNISHNCKLLVITDTLSSTYLLIFSKNRRIPPMESNKNAQLIIPSKFCFPELNDIMESLGLCTLAFAEKEIRYWLTF